MSTEILRYERGCGTGFRLHTHKHYRDTYIPSYSRLDKGTRLSGTNTKSATELQVKGYKEMSSDIVDFWFKKRKASNLPIRCFNESDWNTEIKTMEDVETVLLYGREFEAEYKEYNGVVTTSLGSGFSVFAHKIDDTENRFDFNTLTI